MSMTVEHFETARLTAERLTADHLPELIHMHHDPQVMTTLGGPRDEATTRLYLERNLAHWDQYRFGTWILRDKGSGTFVGRAALRHLLVEGVDEVELGYAFYPEWWGKGLATEIARACVDLGRETLLLPSIVAVSLPENTASQKVMIKVGMVFERMVMENGLIHALYRTGGPISKQ